jgi:hypothetical protein
VLSNRTDDGYLTVCEVTELRLPVSWNANRSSRTFATVNVVVLAGTVSADPFLRRMPSGDEITELRLSVLEAGIRLLPPVAAWQATVAPEGKSAENPPESAKRCQPPRLSASTNQQVMRDGDVLAGRRFAPERTHDPSVGGSSPPRPTPWPARSRVGCQANQGCWV